MDFSKYKSASKVYIFHAILPGGHAPDPSEWGKFLYPRYVLTCLTPKQSECLSVFNIHSTGGRDEEILLHLLHGDQCWERPVHDRDPYSQRSALGLTPNLTVPTVANKPKLTSMHTTVPQYNG